MNDIIYINDHRPIRVSDLIGKDVYLAEDASHGDWKTASVRPGRWPTLGKGSKVRVKDIWSNFYGRQVRVISDSGELYDIEPNKISLESK